MGAAALLPVMFGPWLYDMYVLPKMLAASWLLAMAAAALMSGVSSSAVDLPLAALGIAAVLSAMTSLDPWLSWVGSYRSYSGSLLGWGLCGAAFYASCSIQTEDFPERLAHGVVFGSLPVSVYALLQKAGIDFSWAVASWRAYSTFGSPVHLGAYLIIVIPLALHMALDRRVENSWDQKLGTAALFLGILGLAAAKTRSAWIGGGMGITAYAFLRKFSLPSFFSIGNKARGARALLYGLIMLSIFCVLSMEYFGARKIASDLQRLEVWRSSIAMFREHPWLGVGPDAFVAAFRQNRRVLMEIDRTGGQMNAHNDWLQVLATLGLAGVAAYVWLHVQAVLFLARSQRWKKNFFTPIFCSLFAVFIYSKLNISVWTVLFLSALLAGCLLRKEGVKGGSKRLKAAALRTISIGMLICCSWLAWADHEEVAGVLSRRAGYPRVAAARLQRAVQLNPWETTYRLNLDNLLWDAAASEPDIAQRRALLDWAAVTAFNGVGRRPADAMAYFLLGRAELRRCVWGGEDRLEPARLALAEARRLDPGFGPIQEDIDFLATVKMSERRKHAMGPYLSASDYANGSATKR